MTKMKGRRLIVCLFSLMSCLPAICLRHRTSDVLDKPDRLDAQWAVERDCNLILIKVTSATIKSPRCHQIACHF